MSSGDYLRRLQELDISSKYKHILPLIKQVFDHLGEPKSIGDREDGLTFLYENSIDYLTVDVILDYSLEYFYKNKITGFHLAENNVDEIYGISKVLDDDTIKGTYDRSKSKEYLEVKAHYEEFKRITENDN